MACQSGKNDSCSVTLSFVIMAAFMAYHGGVTLSEGKHLISLSYENLLKAQQRESDIGDGFSFIVTYDKGECDITV